MIKWVNELFNFGLKEVCALDFYRDVFPVGELQRKGIYEKLMQIDRVQRGEAKFYFNKKDNALYLQDAKKRNVPEKLESETTYLKGFWESFWD